MIRVIREEAATLCGLLVFLILVAFGDSLSVEAVGAIGSTVLLGVLFAIMMWCSFAAVHHAEALAALLGEPFGTLILTLAVIIIEVALISAVMLTGTDSPTVARDTMMAVVMIAMNLLVGVSLILGGIRHKAQAYNLQGANAFLAVLIPLAVFSLIFPSYTQSAPGGQVSVLQGIYLTLASVALYGIFLTIQTTTHSDLFRQPAEAASAKLTDTSTTDHAHSATHSGAYHAIALVASLIPVILLAKKFAGYLDHIIGIAGAPLALGGLLVAILILTPEGLSAIRAAQENSLQRAVNLCLGSALASIGLTVPAVIAISWLVNEPLELGLGVVESMMLVLTLLVSMVTFVSARTNVMQGAVHLALFFGYVMYMFDTT